jgi:hypothetical protein
MSLFFGGDSIVLCYRDVNAAKQWWINVFDCKEVPVPPDWDNKLPSDVALKLPGDVEPTVLLSSRSEVEPAGPTEPGHPIVFTHKLKKAYERVCDRGAAARPLREEGGMWFFEITDPEGNVIEVCNEP